MTRRALPLLVVLPALALAQPVASPGPQVTASRTLRIAPLAGATHVVRDGRTVVFAEGRLGRLAARTEAAVWNVVESLAPALGVDAPRSELAIGRVETDALGMFHAWLHRVESGHRVLDSELVLHFDAGNVLVSVNGRYLPSFDRAVTTGTQQPGATFLANALRVARAEASRRGEQASPGHAELRRFVVWPYAQEPRLAAEVLVELAPHLRWHAYVDALNGRVHRLRDLVRREDGHAVGQGVDTKGVERPVNLTHYGELNLYGSIDRQNHPTVLSTLNAQNSQEGSGTAYVNPQPLMTDPAAVDVHTHMRRVFDYFQQQHGRLSFDGQGKSVVSLVHYGSGFVNAFWNGELMAFGDGSEGDLGELHRCLDVAGHEFSHAVVQHTAALVYENQSGALNEHFADVFGTLIENEDWLMGEDCSANGRGIRNLEAPSEFNQPASMNEYVNAPNDGTGDNGGVHINSGIPNRVAWILGRDGSLGKEVVGRLWFRALSAGYLTSYSQLVDLRRGVLRAATDLQYFSAIPTIAAAFDEVGLRELPLPNGGQCPVNASVTGTYCTCNPGHVTTDDGLSCREVPGIVCPTWGYLAGTQCQCAPGWTLDESKNECVPGKDACPANSHWDYSVGCTCNEGFQGDAYAEGGCVVIPSPCGTNEQRDATGACACLPGWVAGESGCVPGESGCGNESFYGRCDGQVLVYCEADRIERLDCAGAGRRCDFEDPSYGYNCMAASDCHGYTRTGTCESYTGSDNTQRSLLRWCEAGIVREHDCGTAACEWNVAVAGYWCGQCTRNASPVEKDGVTTCECDAGFHKDSYGLCVADGAKIDGVAAGEDEGGGSDAGGGCGCAGVPPAGAVLLLALLARRRRR